ncbi:hypothetical protein BN439_1281 [Erwinia amylovora Ea644]|nr:hypothetical protein EaACW_0998 [Erwinia amylovora ACW56400]CCO81627.1 hypothetical protein BN433_1032 [Erwinia amylovora Ea266]CCP02361.1 hypothetical protein BN439_1281 [Erwinia amylovora Ea644]CCP06386.1 hypothetical protein BN440_1342 [Erwinia amylovora MR1]
MLFFLHVFDSSASLRPQRQCGKHPVSEMEKAA